MLSEEQCAKAEVVQISCLHCGKYSSKDTHVPVIYVCFIDFRLALDLSEREQIYEIMRQYGLPAQVEKMRQNSCVGFQCLAKAGKTVGDTYKLRT